MGAKIELFAQSIIASVIRLWLISSEFNKPISSSIEISTPLNSWKRIVEGVYLLNENEDPYHGDLLHEPPLHLYTYKFFIEYLQEYLPCIFIISDILAAYFLYLTAEKYLKSKLKENKVFIKKGNKKKLFSIKFNPISVFTAYLFNPYIILNCVAMTTTVFSNFFLALYLFLLVSKQIFLCCLSAAISTTHTLYSARLIIPIFMNLNDKQNISKIKVVLLFLSFLIEFQYISYLLSGNWNYIENTYGFMLLAPDMTPNIGMYWYCFTEIFKQFRLLYLSIFNIHALFLYLTPLSIKFRKDPIFLAAILIFISAIFKFYPGLGDIGFCLSLISIWSYLFKYIQYSFFVLCVFITTSVLGPILWYMWIYSRSANANFFFGVTLVFVLAQMFVFTDLIYAYYKRDYCLKNNQEENDNSNTRKWNFTD